MIKGFWKHCARKKRSIVKVLNTAFLGIFIAAGVICAATATAIEAIVFVEQFKKPTPWGSLIPLVLGVAISFEVSKTFLHYYCASSAIDDEAEKRRKWLFYNPVRALLTAISLASAVVFCCWQLARANFVNEAKALNERIDLQQQTAINTANAEFDAKSTAQAKADDQDVKYWQDLFDAQQKIRGWNGKWIGPQAQEIQPKLDTAKQRRDTHRNDLLQEKTARLEKLRTEFAQHRQSALDQLRASRDSDSPIIGAVLTLFRPDYPRGAYTTFVIAQGAMLSVAMEALIMVAFMILGGFERRRSLSQQIGNDFDSLEEVVQNVGDRIENDILGNLSRQFSTISGNGEKHFVSEPPPPTTTNQKERKQ